MPFLRVIRDKRGYETTYLMHWFREGTRQRSRILYIFRTPAGVCVGRESLEPEVLRDIEAQHPDIDFDWKTVLGNRQVIETAPDPRALRKRRRTEDERAPGTEVTASPSPEARSREAAGTPAPARPPIPSALEGSTPDEQIAFLVRWYPIVRDRLPQRISDPARIEALLALAERLNPAAWSDPDQVAAGLQKAGESLERLSRVLARRRRRSRRTSTRPASAGPTGSGAELPALSAAVPDAAGGTDPSIEDE